MKRITVASSAFRLELPDHDWHPGQVTDSLHEVSQLLHLARQAGLSVRLTRIVKLSTANSCSWCRARPRDFEWDCDGLYETALCGSPQCREARRLAYEGLIAYPSHQRSERAPRLVRPIRVTSTGEPTRGVVTVDQYDDLNCACGNIPSYAGFQPCLPNGTLVEPDHPEWDGCYLCVAVGCEGVIVDCRDLDSIQAETGETVTDAFPVEIQDQCGDCLARRDAPSQEHHIDCSVNWN